MTIRNHISTVIQSSSTQREITIPGAVEVSIVMPCLNESRTVGRCVTAALKALDDLGVNGEIVVGDNGSSDGSDRIARDCGARVVQAEQRGYGNALQAAIAAAQGSLIVMGDADDSYDFTRIAPFVERLRAGDDFVLGNRFRGRIEPGAMPWLHRYVGNPLLTGILNLFFHSSIRDAHCGLRGFRKNSYCRLGLQSPGMEFASEMVVKACLQGMKLSEVPIVLRPDGRDRPPHLRSFHDGWRHLRLLLMFCPTWLYLIPSTFLLGLGMVLMIRLSLGPWHIGPVVLGVHSMLLGSLCVIMGYQTLWIGAYALTCGWIGRLLPEGIVARTMLRRTALERGLVVGLTLALMGLGANLWLLMEWMRKDFGEMQVTSTLRYAVWGLTAIVLGVQTIYGSFFLGMMSLLDRAADRQ